MKNSKQTLGKEWELESNAQKTVFKFEELQSDQNSYHFYLFKQIYNITYSNVGVLAKELKRKQIIKDNERFNITPTDLRASVKFGFHGQQEFLNEDNGGSNKLQFVYNYLVLTNLRLNAITNNAFHPSFVGLDSSDEARRINSRQARDAHDHWKNIRYTDKFSTFYFYPLTKEEEDKSMNAMVVNNILKPLSNIKPGQVVILDLEVVNIGKIDSQFEGFFKLTQLGENPIQHDKKEWPLPHAGNYNSGDNRYSPVINLHKFTNTERTIFLPHGWQYRLDAYLKLDDEHMEFQSDMILDYR